MRGIRARISRADSARRLTAAGVDVFFGEARFTGTDALDVDGATLRFKKALIATGARPDTPAIPGLVEAGYLTNENVFDLTELPRRLLVIGGGPLGCELAQAFCRFGAQTIIVQKRPLFLPREERDAAQILSDAFARDGIEVRLNTRARQRARGRRPEDRRSRQRRLPQHGRRRCHPHRHRPGAECRGSESGGGRRRLRRRHGIHVDDFLRTSNPRIYAAGDACLEHKFNDTADASARIAVQNALFARPPAAERADDSVVHLHRPGDRPRRPLCAAGARAEHSGEDLHHPDARRRSRDRRRRGGGLREDPRQGAERTGFSARRSSPVTRAR